MLIQFQEFLTFKNVYLWSNFGILPFWLMLIIIPNSKFTRILINSVIIPLIISAAYVYIFYQIVLSQDPLHDLFKLYLSLDDLYTIFATEGFLLIFWLHFLAINLFVGSWISRDGARYNVSKTLVSIPLILVYFTGPLGIVIYWFIRIFYAKKLGFHE